MHIDWEEQASLRYSCIRFEMSRDDLQFMATLL